MVPSGVWLAVEASRSLGGAPQSNIRKRTKQIYNNLVIIGTYFILSGIRAARLKYLSACGVIENAPYNSRHKADGDLLVSSKDFMTWLKVAYEF